MLDGGSIRDAFADASAPVDADTRDASTLDTAGEDAALGDAAIAGDAGLDAAPSVDAGPPPGESCGEPITVVLTDGRAHIVGTLGDYRSDHTTFCGEAGARDVVYMLEVGSGLHDIDIVTGPATLDTIVGISDDCVTFWDCEDDRSATDKGARLLLHRYPGSRIFFFVKGFRAATLGDFTVDVEVRNADPAGSTCATAIDLTGGAKVIAWRVDATTPLATSCATGADLIDAYHLGPEPDGTIADVSVYFGAEARSVAVVRDCSATPGESWCEPSVLTDGAWQVYESNVPTTGIGDRYVAIVGGPVPGTNAYSMDVAP